MRTATSSTFVFQSLLPQCPGSRWSIPQSRPDALSRRHVTRREKFIGCRLTRLRCSLTEHRGRSHRAASQSCMAHYCSTASVSPGPRPLQCRRGTDSIDMSSRAAFLQLAELIGVEARYTDAFGQTREASDHTLLALTPPFALPSDPFRAPRHLEAQPHFFPLGLEAAHLVQVEDQRPEVLL